MGGTYHPGGAVPTKDISLSRDRKGLWSGEQEYSILKAQFPTVVPAIGSSHPEYPFLAVEDVEVRGQERGVMLMRVQYNGSAADDDPDDPDEDDEENPEEYNLDLSVSDEPLGTHKRYTDVLSAEDISEAVELATNPPKGDDGKTVETVDTSEWEELKKELYDFVRKGFEAYREPRVTWTARWVSKNRPQGLNDIGNISDPRGNPPQVAAGRNWLKVGLRSTEKGRVFENEEVWELSGRGGWDQKIYSD